MAELQLSRRNLDFLLYDWLKTDELIARNCFHDHSREGFDAILDLGATMALQEFYPINKILDQDEPRFEGGNVVTPACLKPAIKAYREAGFIGMALDAKDGGMQLPQSIKVAVDCYFAAASAGAGVLGLTAPNASTILLHGTEWQKKTYIPKMLAGEYTGTMCLSEPQAGSSLSDITTKALLQDDGTYRLFGRKMWISGGDGDYSKNIIHLVLAKIEGAPLGTKGISLFIVPKFLEDGTKNDVVAAGLNHKMGWRGTPNCLMNFGESGKGAFGTIVGKPHEGLSCMFHMMNDARIMIGAGAAAIGSAGFLHSLEYAKTRVQGRLPADKNPASPPLTIIHHSDIKRMLLAQKAYVEGSLALVLYCARLSDDVKSTGEKDVYLLLELLTPIAKSYPSQFCLEANSLAIQIHGGYGYTRDFNVEQYYRDQRLNPIHEGTHGIQGLDLLGRKVKMADGKAFKILSARILATINASKNPHKKALKKALALMSKTLKTLLDEQDLNLQLANSSVFLECFGHLVVAWLWLSQTNSLTEDDAFAKGKRAACDHYFTMELPKINHFCEVLMAKDDLNVKAREEWF